MLMRRVVALDPMTVSGTRRASFCSSIGSQARDLALRLWCCWSPSYAAVAKKRGIRFFAVRGAGCK